MMPPRTDMVSLFTIASYAFSSLTGIVNLANLHNVLAAGARQCAANQDVAGFHQITDDWEKLVHATARSDDNVLSLLVARSILTGPAAYFRDAAQTLGLDAEAQRFAVIHERAKADKETRKRRSHDEFSPESLARSHGSIVVGMSIPTLANQVKSPPPLIEADLRPGRYADHAMFGRTGSLLAWMLLGIGASGAVLGRYRHGPDIRCRSAGMLETLRGSDWLWVVVGGILVCALTVPLHYAEECHWTQLDPIIDIPPAAPAMTTRYESQVTRQLRAELLEMIAAAKW